MFTNCQNRNHEESVYNLIQQNPTYHIKPPMYRSRYSDLVRGESCCQKSGAYRTMGLPQTCLCPPSNYLKKQSRAPISVRPAAIPKVRFVSETCSALENVAGEPTPAQLNSGSGDNVGPPPAPCSTDATCGTSCQQQGQGDAVLARMRVPRLCCNREKPAVPSANMGFGVLERGKKDFVMDNALKVIRQPAKVPDSRIVDHPRGDRFEWRTSGWPRKYVFREDFGMIPGYLVQRKRELYEMDQKSKLEAENADAACRDKCRHLDETERQVMVNGLKTNWSEMFREYQSLPLLIDTPALIKKKGELEEGLKDLEKDIQFMERHNHIFVADTDKTFYLSSC